jgi:hypothetical protein
MQQRKDRRVCANAEAHRQGDENRESRLLPTHANGITDVLTECFETRPAPDIATALPFEESIAESPVRHPARLVRRQARLTEALGAEFEMMSHLVGEFLIVTIPPQSHPERAPLFAEPRHGYCLPY